MEGQNYKIISNFILEYILFFRYCHITVTNYHYALNCNL